MRVLHFSDLHIGVENYGRTDPTTGLSTRLGDFLEALDEVVEFALTQQIDLVLLAGDAYKGRDPSQTHQREFASRLARLSLAGIPVFLLVGNHDLPNAVSRATSIEIFSTLEVPNIYVGNQLQNYTIPTPSGPLQIVGVPWPRRSGMLTREETRGLSIEEIRQEVERRMTLSIENQSERLDPSLPAILAGHATVNGATVGAERSMMLGQDHVLLASALDRPQLDYIGLGHIHKHQVLRQTEQGHPRVVYSGSLQRVDFSEERDEKGFCVIDLDPNAPQGQRLTNFAFQKVKARPFVTIEVKINSPQEDPTQATLRAIDRQRVAGAVVRVRVTMPADIERQLQESEIREALGSAHFIAAISREVEGGRRIRLGTEVGEGLQPAQTLRLYLESRGIDQERQEKLLRYADELIKQDLSRLAE